METSILKFLPSIILTVLAVGLAIVGQVILGVILVLVAVGVLAFQSIKSTATTRVDDPMEGLDPEGRSIMTRFRKIRTEIAELSATIPKGSATAILIAEATAEADRIVRDLAPELRNRRAIKKAIAGASLAQQELERLQAQRDSAPTDDERAAYQVAIEAKTQEIAHYATGAEAIERLDENFRRAEAALREMRARLQGRSITDAAERTSEGDLRETISRMRAVTQSVDETRAFLGDDAGRG